MSDSTEMARVVTAVQGIEKSVDRLVTTILEPTTGIAARLGILEERNRVFDEERKRVLDIDNEMRLTHRVGRWVGTVMVGAFLLAIASMVINLMRHAP